jgi:uncharacterized glyoxalase superfamily protein PhnB
MKITNLLLWVQENKLSEKFYKRLGFDVVRSDDSHSVVRLGNFEIVLVSMRDEEPFTNDAIALEKSRGMYIYVLVDDIDNTYSRLQKNGITPYTEPKNWDWENREFIVKDPDGYKLCFWQKVNDEQH